MILAPRHALAAVLSSAALTSVLMVAACTGYDPYPVCDFRALDRAGMTRPSPSGPALVSSVPGALQPMPLNTVNVTDHNILRKVMVQSVGARRTETSTVQVSAQLVNCTDYPLQVEGRTRFFDTAQVETEPVSAWQRVMLSPRTVATYSERSIGADQAASYLVELREGR